MNSKKEATFKTTWLWLFLMGGLLLAYSPGIAGEPPKGGRERVVVDLSQQKNGCVDCHQGKINTPDGKEKDVTLASEVRSFPKHPQLKADATIKDCLTCHKAGAMKTRFINRLHDIHLNSPIYVGEFKETCGGCHSMKQIKGL